MFLSTSLLHLGAWTQLCIISVVFLSRYFVQNSVPYILRKEITSLWENSGFHDDHCQFLLTKSRNFSKHFIMYKPQSVLFGCGGIVGYLICFTCSVFFARCGNFADHTSWRYLVIFSSTDLCSLLSESSIIREMCGWVLTITRVQWWPRHMGITRYFLEKMSVFFVHLDIVFGLTCVNFM